LSVVTKETLNVNASYSQTLANIDLTKFEGNPTMDLISSRARNDIRRGLSNGISVNFGSKYISDFYLTYRKRMQELGTPHHGISFFQKLLQHFPRELSIGVAKQKSKLLAVSMDLHIGGIVYHLFAASTPEKRNSCAGDLLLWAKIADSINKGEREFWLGRSIVDSGVERYKAKWNPEFLPTSERITQIEKDLEIAHKQMNSETKKRVFAEIWKIIPSTQANLIGPPIRKLIP
jgi:lipid II:glycine glycyltransferase (peptidoglycan interpeptide bridge formation enzyme)